MSKLSILLVAILWKVSLLAQCPPTATISSNGNCFNPGVAGLSIPLFQNSSGSIYWGASNNGCNNYVNYTGTITINDRQCTYQTGVLPVVFSDFNIVRAENKTVGYFTTSTETNNNFFTVERSIDAINFDPIIKIPGSINSTRNTYYTFEDEKPIHGVSYYRVKQTDFDGKYSYSDVRQVNYFESKEILVYPTMTSSMLSIISPISPIEVTIFDHRGNEVKKYQWSHDSFQYNLDQLPQGIYYVKVNDKHQIITKRIVKI